MILPHVQRKSTKTVYGYDGWDVFRFVCTSRGIAQTFAKHKKNEVELDPLSKYTYDYWMACDEITKEQYEAFKPTH